MPLLWIIYPAMIPDLLLAPSHTDLQRVALAAWDFLKDKIPSLPQDSGIKVFLGTANDYGWDVKRKLVWLATNSYMFRLFYRNYIFDQNGSKLDIGHTDDFVCQECTRWSGLGATDILARVLEITDDERHELRSWCERLAALYLLKSVSNETIEALNVINETKYRIRLNVDGQPFKEGQLVFGSLTPWRGEWYWSGAQQTFDNPSEKQVDDFRNTMRRNSSHIVCRYHKEYEKLVRERAADYHNFMMNYYGKDLIIYPDGLSMAADWEKEFRTNWESKPPEKVKEAVERHDLKGGKPNMPLPDDLLESKNGLAVFINSDEGKEIVKEYNSIVSGMRKRGEDLTKDEEDAIRGFIFADAISPAFVKRVVCKFGDESIKAAFLLGKCADIYWLEYLLRSLKGTFFRKRYPSFSVI